MDTLLNNSETMNGMTVKCLVLCRPTQEGAGGATAPRVLPPLPSLPPLKTKRISQEEMGRLKRHHADLISKNLDEADKSRLCNCEEVKVAHTKGFCEALRNA
jgi:hypothetical protein